MDPGKESSAHTRARARRIIYAHINEGSFTLCVFSDCDCDLFLLIMD